MKIRFGYRLRIAFIFIGLVIGLISLIYTNYIARELAIKEKHEIGLWARAISLQNRHDTRSKIEWQVLLGITNITTSIPAIITDQYLRVKEFHNVDSSIINDPILLREELESMSSGGRIPIEVRDYARGQVLTVFYGDSALLQSMYYFPYIQISVIGVFVLFAFLSFSSSKHNEQNRVWVGLAKETAHQLGTPTSSLLGWVEYLRTQDIPPEIVEDINRDVTRLTKVVDRFSKIGSDTILKAENINKVVGSTVDYFQSRVPRGVTINYDRHCPEPYQAMVNESLFAWVIENLLKNALDALGNKGTISVEISARDKWLRIDIKDSGKGMSPSTQRRIFQAGYTTKTRGWGLGLSLSKRIVEQYHKGKISVLSSEIDKGTTMRIALKRL